MGCICSKENKSQNSAPLVGSNQAVVVKDYPAVDNVVSTSPIKTAETDTKPKTAAQAPLTPASVVSRACFGAGCYWGTENYFRRTFGKNFTHLGKITSGQVGFMGPASAPKNPYYQEVCSGVTGHVEVYDFEYYGN
jgi:hypothetical protein